MNLELRCESMAAGGRAVARDGGRVVFVAGACPGDTVLAEVESDKGRFLEATVVSVLEPSPDRVEPRCAHAGTCGGCSWQFLSYTAQLSAKKAILDDALRRLAKLASFPEIEVVAADSPWGGRNRAQFQPPAVEGGGWGFFERGSRRTIPIRECPVLCDELQGSWESLEPPKGGVWAQRRERAAFAYGGQGRSWVRHPDKAPGDPVDLVVAGRRLRFEVDGFFQSNLGLLPAMVRETVGGMTGSVAWDLYAGVGLFAAHLEGAFAAVEAVESDPLAARWAPRNLLSAAFHARPVEAWLEEMFHRGRIEPDFVVVDPPRSGLSGFALEGILACRPRAIRYVSCGHDTLARDLRLLTAKDYRLERIVLIDLYPHTPHMEVVATLLRN